MIAKTETEEIRASYRACKDETHRHAKSFYFSSHVLTAEQKNAAYAVYAFCRLADNTIDAGDARDGSARRQLDQLREQLQRVYNDSTGPVGIWPAFRDTVHRHQIPLEHFLDLLRGVEMDLTRQTYSTFTELEEYCYCVASVVGLVMARIFGVRDSQAYRHAADMGTAMQLTNILRDIKEDYGMGRRYIPLEDMDRFGYSDVELGRGIVNGPFRRLMTFEIERARMYYDSAEKGIPLLIGFGSRACVRLMSRTYGTILNVIESRDYDVFAERASVSAPRKLAIAGDTMLSLLVHGSMTENRPLSLHDAPLTDLSLHPPQQHRRSP